MAPRLPLCLSLLLVVPSSAAAQRDLERESGRLLRVEHRFGPDSATFVATLEKRVVYWVELNGPGTPRFQPAGRHSLAALVAPIPVAAGNDVQRFELFAFQAGPHTVTLQGLPAGSAATLRLYRDVVETRRINQRRDRQLGLSLVLGAGVHTGFRLDPTGGAHPRGGRDIEGCILAETGDWFGTCLGAAQLSFPDAGFSATWLFIEQRVRIWSGHPLGRGRTHLAGVVRYSQGLKAGPRKLDPALLAAGVHVIQYLATDGFRRGVGLYASVQYGRLGSAPETELLNTLRVTAGVAWRP